MRKYFMVTERIGFSRWEENDEDLAFSLWGEKEVTKYICKTGEFTEQEILKRFKTETDNGRLFGFQYWPIFYLETGEFIGVCGMRPYEENIYEFGFQLKSEFWGKRLAFEAAYAAISYAFNHLGAMALSAGHHPENVNSKKVLERLGFKLVGETFYAPTGLIHPSYRLSADEWSDLNH